MPPLVLPDTATFTPVPVKVRVGTLNPQTLEEISPVAEDVVSDEPEAQSAEETPKPKKAKKGK